MASQFTIGKIAFLYFIVALLLFSWIAGWRKITTINMDAVTVLLALFLLSTLLSSVLAASPYYAIFGKYQRFEGWITFLSFAALFLSARLIGLKNAHKIALAVAASTAIVSLYGVLQHFGWDFIDWGNMGFSKYRSFSTNGNPVTLGGFLVIALPVSLSAFFYFKEPLQRSLSIAAIILGGLCLYFTGSQGAWFGAWIAMVAVLFLVGSQKNDKRLKILAGLLFTVTVAYIAILIYWRDPLIYAGSGRSRLYIYRTAWEAFLAKPVFGWGLDNFRFAFQRFMETGFMPFLTDNTLPDKAHNYPLEILTTTGIAGFTLLLSLFVFSLREGYRRIRENAGSYTGILWFSGIIGYLTYLLTGVSDLTGGPLLWIALGLVAGPPAGGFSFKLQPSHTSTIRATGVAIAVALSLIAGSILTADRSFFVAEQLPLPAAEPFYRQAELLHPFNYDYLIDHGPRLIGEAIYKGDHQLWESGVNVFKRALAITPEDGEAHVNLALAYKYGAERFDPGLYAEAERGFNNAITVYPYYIEAYKGLTSTYLASGQYEKSIYCADIANSLKPDTTSYLIKAKSLSLMGRMQESKEALLAAQALEPNNREIQRNIESLSEGTRQ